MKDYFVRCRDYKIEKKVKAETATEAALQLAEQITPAQEWIAFEVEIDDVTTIVNIKFESEDDTIHFSNSALEPVETPLALTLNRNFPRKESQNDRRPSKAIRPVR